MTDHDDKLSRRYRELGREEPPSSIDAAILSAAKRAVQPRALDRWTVPVSIAALLVLGIGVSLRMQMEQPGIEISEPTSSTASEYPMPSAEAPPPPVTPPTSPAPSTTTPSTTTSSTTVTEAQKDRSQAVPPVLAKRVDKSAPEAAARAQPKAFADAPAQAGVAEAPALAAQAPAAPPAPATTPAAAAAPRVEPPRDAMQLRPQSESAAAGPRLAPLRSKREATAADSVEAREVKAPRDEREVELERIARLRSEGKHLEADKTLEEFRRKHPDYRIPEKMWERVKPR